MLLEKGDANIYAYLARLVILEITRCDREYAAFYVSDPVVLAGEASVKSYEAAIIELEGEGDAMQIVELLTEARVLKIQLTRTALEAAIRALAAGGEHARATSMLKSLISEGNEVDPTVLAAVITSLSKTRDSAHFKDMAEVAAGMEVEDSRVSCALARLAARSGEVDDAYVILDKLVSKEQPVDNATFDVVAIELIKAGDERAEEVLEWKEYLAVGLD